jgi:hypothetical protein
LQWTADPDGVSSDVISSTCVYLNSSWRHQEYAGIPTTRRRFIQPRSLRCAVTRVQQQTRGTSLSYRGFDQSLLNGLIQPFQEPARVIHFFDSCRQLYPVSRGTLRDVADPSQSTG